MPLRRQEFLQEAWNVVILLTTTAAALMVPLRLVFHHVVFFAYVWFDIAVTLIFALDLLFRLRRAQQTGKRESVFWYAVDIAAAVPFDLLLGPSVFSLARLLKLFRVGQTLSSWRELNPGQWMKLRLVYFVYWFSLTVHWLATGWASLRGVPHDVEVTTTYVQSLYWCVTTLTTVGYGDITPVTNVEMLYAIVVEIFGIATYGYIIGNIANILVNLDPAKARFRDNMQTLGAFMNTKGITGRLQERMRDHYAYLWQKPGANDETTIMSGLPASLRSEVSLFLKRDVIQKVPFLKDAREDLIRDIALRMTPVVVAPGEYVFHAGETGHEMFFISRGRLEVLGRDGKTLLDTLSDGEIFGEMALLSGQSRNASVRATD
jgi:voltage-gated potassium channel